MRVDVTIPALLDQLGCIQLDPLDPLGTNADLVVMARLPDAAHGEVYRAVYANAFEHFAKVRCIAKGSHGTEGRFRCNGCRATSTALWREYGKWPIGEFLALPEETQHQFYARALSLSGIQSAAECRKVLATYVRTEARVALSMSPDCASHVGSMHVAHVHVISVRLISKSMFVRHRMHGDNGVRIYRVMRFALQEGYAERGRFLPLSVWEKKGFDPDLIESTALDEDIT